MVPDGRAAARRRARPRSRRICGTRSIAVEDHRFFHHLGIDPIGLGRALWRDARGGASRREGGSTLTQQLARTLFLSNKKTSGRKAQEAVLALLLEQELSKNQILELYLNRIYLSGGVYGVETMSQNLFGKPASKLTLPEAALIAGLIRGAVRRCRRGRTSTARSIAAAWCCSACARKGSSRRAGEGGRAGARRASVRIPGPPRRAFGYAKEFLRQQFRDRFGGDHPPDWTVRTTFQPDLQEAAERAVENGLRRSRERPSCRRRWSRSIRRRATCWRWSAGATSAQSQFNRAWRSRRQPGSAFKPFLYRRGAREGLFAGQPAGRAHRRSRRRGPTSGRRATRRAKWRKP